MKVLEPERLIETARRHWWRQHPSHTKVAPLERPSFEEETQSFLLNLQREISGPFTLRVPAKYRRAK